jgi:hypothetical protein
MKRKVLEVLHKEELCHLCRILGIKVVKSREWRGTRFRKATTWKTKKEMGK